MTLQSFLCLEFSIMPSKHYFLYLSLHLSEWNKSKLHMFIKMYTIRRIFTFKKKRCFEKVFMLPRLLHWDFSPKNGHIFDLYIICK